MNHSITLNQVFRQAASIIRSRAYEAKQEPDVTPTAIRTVVNDLNDYWDRGGFKVNHDYNQDRAVRIVRRLVREL